MVQDMGARMEGEKFAEEGQKRLRENLLTEYRNVYSDG